MGRIRTIYRGVKVDMYQNFVLHGGPNDGETCRIRLGVTAVVTEGARYRRVQFPDTGPFLRNEFHWVPGV